MCVYGVCCVLCVCVQLCVVFCGVCMLCVLCVVCEVGCCVFVVCVCSVCECSVVCAICVCGELRCVWCMGAVYVWSVRCVWCVACVTCAASAVCGVCVWGGGVSAGRGGRASFPASVLGLSSRASRGAGEWTQTEAVGSGVPEGPAPSSGAGSGWSGGWGGRPDSPGVAPCLSSGGAFTRRANTLATQTGGCSPGTTSDCPFCPRRKQKVCVCGQPGVWYKCCGPDLTAQERRI